MKKYYFLSIFVITSLYTYSQNRNSVWVFGDSAGDDFINVNNPLPYNSVMDGRGSCASISDTNGNLLFYCYNTTGLTDYGGIIINYINDTIQNGSGLDGQSFYNQFVIVPFPSVTNKYYIFHSGAYSSNGLYYSIVDMSQNNGLGSVIQKNVSLNITRVGDCLQAIKHANGRDWWMMAKYSSQVAPNQYNRFYVFLISPLGISSPIIQDFGNATDGDLQKVVINNTGNKLMNINFIGLMTEYDFDRCTGIISNPNIIFPEQPSNSNRNFWEGAYSPNDSLFYATSTWYSFSVSDTSRLLQFNLFATDIPASCDTLYMIKYPNILGAVRLAPDNKIYMANGYTWGFPLYPYPDSVHNIYTDNLGVINSPDSLGASCNFQPFSFYLGGKRTYWGLPNSPNYQLGPVVGSVCDSLTVGITQFQPTTNELKVFYHPQWQTAFINSKGLTGKQVVLSVYDIAGHLIFRSSKDIINGYYTFDLELSSFSEGMYMVHLQTEKEKLVKKLIKE
jgi:Secretion system C-terminal sorting domain